MTSFLDQLQQTSNRTLTENLGGAHKSTLTPALDFFALGGAMRGRPDAFVQLLEKAYIADPQTALRTLFYLRDIRGGQGERALFRRGLKWLRKNAPETYAQNLRHVPEYGRWDDIVELPLTWTELILLREQFAKDYASMVKGDSVSLLAKWLPSENTSSKVTVEKARQAIQFFGTTPRNYRKTVVALRKHIGLLEHKMSARDWEAIDFSKLPSQALRKHTKAFRKHLPEAYELFINRAKKGEVKLNTSTLYTYEIFKTLAHDEGLAEAQWAQLPDWTQGNHALVVADVSGSMTWGTGLPITVSVSLALYFAERNVGPFKDYFITFSESPQLVKVQGNGLAQRFRSIQNSSGWGMNTNLEAVFDLILDTAIRHKTPQEELPKIIYIISDMEFDQCVSRNETTSYVQGGFNETVLENAQRKWAQAEYILPHVVFWNVDARQNQVPATKFDNRVTLVSGLSQSTFRYVVEGKTPEQFMLDVVNSERYSKLVLA